MERRARPATDECCTLPPRSMPPLAVDRDQVLGMFKALADGTRLDVFRLIAAQDGPICACDIVDQFDVSQPTIAHHLRVLRESGLITVSRAGIWAYYAVSPSGVEALHAVTGELTGMREATLLQKQ